MAIPKYYQQLLDNNIAETFEERKRRKEQEKLIEMQSDISIPETSPKPSSVPSTNYYQNLSKQYLTSEPSEKIVVPEKDTTSDYYTELSKKYLNSTDSTALPAPVKYDRAYSLDDLDNDEYFQKVSNRFLTSIGTDEDIYETLRDSDWSITDALARAYNSGKWTDQQKADYKYLRNTFDKAEVGGLGQVLEATKDIAIDIVADPLNLIAGLFIVGSGGAGVAGATAVSRIAASQALKTGAKKLANQKGFRAVSMGLTEGAYDAGLINVGTQLTEIQTGVRQAGTEFSMKEASLSAGLGATAGATLVGGAHKLANYMLRKEHDKLVKTFGLNDELKNKAGEISAEAVSEFKSNVKFMDKITSQTVGKPLTEFIEDSKNSPVMKQLLLNFRHDTFRRIFSARSEKIDVANMTFSREAESISNTYAVFIKKALQELEYGKEGDTFLKRFFNPNMKLTEENDLAVWSLLSRGNVLDKYMKITPVDINKPLHSVNTKTLQPIHSPTQASGVPKGARLSKDEFEFLKQYNANQLEAAAKIRYFLKQAHKEASDIDAIDPKTGLPYLEGRLAEGGERVPFSLFETGQQLDNYLPRKYIGTAMKEKEALVVAELATTSHSMPKSAPKIEEKVLVDSVQAKIGTAGRERKYIPDPSTGEKVKVYTKELTEDQDYFFNLKTKNLPHIKERVANGENIDDIKAESLFNRYDSFEDMAIADINLKLKGTLDISNLNEKQWNKIIEIAKEYKAQALFDDFLKKETEPSYLKSIAAFHSDNGISKPEFLNPRVWNELDDKFLIDNGLIQTDAASILEDYAWKLGHKIKEEKYFGYGSTYIGRYLKPIRDELVDNNYDPLKAKALTEKLLTVRDYATGGRYANVDLSDVQKGIYDGIKVSQILAHLPFATLSSITEPLIALGRSDLADTPAFVKEFSKGIGKSTKKSAQRFYNHMQAARGKEVKGFKDLSDEDWLDAYRAGVATEQAMMTKIEGMFAEGMQTGKAKNIINAFFNVNFLQQWTQGVQLGAFNYAKERSIRILGELAEDKNVYGIQLTTNSRGRKADQLREIGIDPKQGVAAYRRALDKDGIFNKETFKEDPFYDTEFTSAAALFSKEIILNPSAAELNKPMWFNSPGAGIFVQFAGYPTAFNNTVLKGFARDVIRHPTANAPKVIAASGMMAGTATLMNWLRSGGESLKDRKDTEIILQSFERPGLLGWLQYPLRYYEGTQYGAGFIGSSLKSISGPFVGDVVDGIAYRQPWFLALGTNLPGYGALSPQAKRDFKEMLRITFDKKESDPRLRRAKGGEVVGVLNVKEEPDEVKMRGLPYSYSELAGPLFQDEEERGAFAKGGKAVLTDTEEAYTYITKDEDAYNIQLNNNPIDVYTEEELPNLKIKDTYYTGFKGNTVSDRLNSVRQSNTIGLLVTKNKNKAQGVVKAQGKIKFNTVLKLDIARATPEAVQSELNKDIDNVIKIADKVVGKEIIKATNDNLAIRDDIFTNDPNKTSEKKRVVEKSKSFLVRHQLLKLGYDAIETKEGYVLLRENQFLPTEIMERRRAKFSGGLAKRILNKIDKEASEVARDMYPEETKPKFEKRTTRVNNPGNIERGQGFAGETGNIYAEERIEKGMNPFVAFDTKHSGIRAMAVDLNTKMKNVNNDAELAVLRYLGGGEYSELLEARKNNDLTEAYKKATLDNQYAKRYIDRVTKAYNEEGFEGMIRRMIIEENTPEVAKYYLDDPYDVKLGIQLSTQPFDSGTTTQQMKDFFGDKLFKRQQLGFGGLASKLAQRLSRKVMPAPQRFLDKEDKAYKPFLKDFEFTEGGRYIEMDQKGPKDITGEYPKQANISVDSEGKASLSISKEIFTEPPETSGKIIRTNLFKKKAGWKWLVTPKGFDPNPQGNFPIVSVETGNKHYYSLSTDFPKGVELSRYAKKTSEPRLRPTTKGDLKFGDIIGKISVRGKEHPVYNNLTVESLLDNKQQFNKGGLVRKIILEEND